MFDDIYDNGDYLLGKVANVINYIHTLILEERIDDEDAYEILNELGKEKPNTIACIYYNHPMGYSIEYWTYEDKVKEV